MAQKASTRRVILHEVLKLINEMIQVNETVFRQDAVMSETSLGAADKIDAIQAIMEGAFPAHKEVNGTDLTIASKIVGILYGNVDVNVGGVPTTIDWTHDDE